MIKNKSPLSRDMGVAMGRILSYMSVVLAVEAVVVIAGGIVYYGGYFPEDVTLSSILAYSVILSAVFLVIIALVKRFFTETESLKLEFLALVAHKLRTPLTRIKWAAEDIKAVVKNDKKESLDAILESDRQILAMTDTLVHLSETDSSSFRYNPRPVVMADVFADLSEQYGSKAKQKGVELVLSPPPHLVTQMDPDASAFVFQILIDNALNYTPAGGSVRVRSYRDAGGRWGFVEVKDTGIGMSRETAARLFKRFYRGGNARRSDNEGFGIGLYMAKSIIEKQGGRISVESKGEGKGSVFTVKLPLAMEPIAG